VVTRCSTSGTVSTEIGNRLLTGIPLQCGISRGSRQLRLREMVNIKFIRKLESKQASCAIHSLRSRGLPV